MWHGCKAGRKRKMKIASSFVCIISYVNAFYAYCLLAQSHIATAATSLPPHLKAPFFLCYSAWLSAGSFVYFYYTSNECRKLLSFSIPPENGIGLRFICHFRTVNCARVMSIIVSVASSTKKKNLLCTFNERINFTRSHSLSAEWFWISQEILSLASQECFEFIHD